MDEVAPVLAGPVDGDLNLECGDIANVQLITDWLDSVTASDACDQDVTIENDLGDIADLLALSPCANNDALVTEVTFTATDDCGNESEIVATITISDDTAPVAPEAPADVLVECEAEIPASVDLSLIHI